MTIDARIRAYVELSRVSNLPTCATNVLVGATIGVAGGEATGIDWPRAAGSIVAIMLLYVAGVALNDVIDAKIDAEERPERPVPSGRISESAALRYVWICLTLGLGIMAIQHGLTAFLFGFGLTVAIFLYDFVHTRTATAVVLMGACRALVYVCAATAQAWPLDWSVAAPLAAALGLYIVMLTLVARVETSGRRRTRFALALILPVVAASPLIFVTPESWSWPAVFAAATVSWILLASTNLLATPPRIGGAVHGWLAGICLVDATYLALLGDVTLAAVAGGCFVVTLLAQRRVSGT